jgi:hypothetical protein
VSGTNSSLKKSRQGLWYAARSGRIAVGQIGDWPRGGFNGQNDGKRVGVIQSDTGCIMVTSVYPAFPQASRCEHLHRGVLVPLSLPQSVTSMPSLHVTNPEGFVYVAVGFKEIHQFHNYWPRPGTQRLSLADAIGVHVSQL